MYARGNFYFRRCGGSLFANCESANKFMNDKIFFKFLQQNSTAGLRRKFYETTFHLKTFRSRGGNVS